MRPPLFHKSQHSVIALLKTQLLSMLSWTDIKQLSAIFHVRCTVTRSVYRCLPPCPARSQTRLVIIMILVILADSHFLSRVASLGGGAILFHESVGSVIYGPKGSYSIIYILHTMTPD